MPKLPPRKNERLNLRSQTETPPPIPRRVSKDYEPQHCYSDGKGGVWTHRGRSRDCGKPECVQWHREQWTTGSEPPPEPAPWGYSDEHVESWTDSLPDPPDPLAPCPRWAGGMHYWQWGDDENGHSGDVCACGAYRE